MGQLFKNVSGQKVRVFAFADAGHATLDPGEPVTGDAAQITAYTAADNAALGASNDVNPAEVDSTNAPGVYEFDATQSETNGSVVEWYPKSSTAGVQVVTIGGNVQQTLPQYLPVLGIGSDGDLLEVNSLTGHTAQTGDSFARLGAPAGASVSVDVAAIKTDTGNLVTRIPAALFSGITSLAEWLGLIAGKQTGDATALTEIKATGAGSGTYDPTTDSNEAIRDTAPLGTAMRGTDNAATAAALTTAQNDLDIITGADGVVIASAEDHATATALSSVATNVSTLLTRIPAALFAGITSMAEWLGLLAGKQVGDTTARTELRATGAGSGTFDETTDSLEAVRDHVGDGTNLTEAGGTGDHLSAIPAGTLTSGERDAIAAAILDLADGVETNTTVREHLRLAAAALYGATTGSGTVFKSRNGLTDRITTTMSGSDRQSVALDDT